MYRVFALDPAVAWVSLTPCLNTGNGCRPAVIVRVLCQPLRLTGFLARGLAGQGVAVLLVVSVTPLRRESQTTMPTLPLFLFPHFVSPPNAHSVGLLHELRRKPKKNQTAKNSQLFYSTTRRKANFTSASYGQFQVGRDNRWNDFENFLADMGECSEGMTIERKDNDGNYSPENCIWATRSDQAKNTRRTRFVEHNGITLPVRDWERKLGFSRGAIQRRLESGWSNYDALTSPIQPGKSKKRRLECL